MRNYPRNLWLLIALFFCLPPVLAAKTHIDRSAGIKFLVPFKNARILRGPQVQAPAHQPPGASPAPAQTLVSTAIYAPQNLPSLMITVHGAQHRITRALADSLAAQGSGRSAALAWLGSEGRGLNNFSFDLNTLRGTGDLPEERGVKSKVLLQLVRDRVTVLRYNYRTDKELEGWQSILSTIKVGRLSLLNYHALPDASPNSVLAWIAGAMGALALVLLLSGATWLAYKKMARGPEVQGEPSALPGFGPGVDSDLDAAPTPGDEPYFPIIASARSSLPKGADS